MKVELIDHSEHAEATIARSAGICFGKDDSDGKRVGRIKKSGHLAVMRFAHAVFKITDISRACQNQLVRSKHLDFLVESQRYVDQSDRGFVMPKGMGMLAEELVERIVEDADNTYNDLEWLVSMLEGYDNVGFIGYMHIIEQPDRHWILSESFYRIFSMIRGKSKRYPKMRQD